MRRFATLIAVAAAAAVVASGAAAAIEVAITSPADGSHSLGGVVPVNVTASATSGVYGVQLLVDGVPYGSLDTAPVAQYQYVINWDTTGITPGTHVLTVQALDWSLPFPPGGATQTSAPVTVDVGAAFPTIQLDTPPSWTFARGQVPLSASVTTALDPTSVAFTVDGTSVATVNAAPWNATWNTATTADGSHVVTATVTDGRGKQASASSQVTVDNTPPSVALLQPGVGATASTTLAAQAHASDAYGIKQVRFLVDGTQSGNAITSPDAPGGYTYSSTLDVSALAAGKHSLVVEATDSAGNVATTTATQFTVGAALPTIQLVTPPAWTFARGQVALSANVTSSVAPTSVAFTVDGTSVATVNAAPWNATWNTATTADGSHVVTATVTDGQGHKASASATVTVDNTPPSVWLLQPGAGASATGTLAAQAHASDAYGIAQVRFLVDGTQSGNAITSPDAPGGYTYSSTLDVSALAPGKHSLVVEATDSAGNVATNSATQFTVGVTPLTATLTSPGDWTFGRGTTQVTATVTGGLAPLTETLLVDGVASPLAPTVNGTTVSFAWDTTALTATHQLAVRVTDAAADTVTTATVNVTVDNVAPEAFLLQPIAVPGWGYARSNGPTTFSALASDGYGVHTVQFAVDGTPVGLSLTQPDSGQQYVWSTSFDTSTLTPGTHAITAIVTDNAGNVTTSAPVSLKSGPIDYLPVLNYHSINPPDGYSVYDQTPAEADQQLAWLQANGYHSVTLAQYQQWLSGADIGVSKPVLITVDDGLADELAWDPLLQKYGFTAVMFVVTGYADNNTPGAIGDPNNLTWAQIQTLAASGRWEIALHAGQYGHTDLSDGTVKIGQQTWPLTCWWWYTCLSSTAGTQETPAAYETAVTNELNAAIARLQAQVPTASTLAFACPWNACGQWTVDYNDASGTAQAWLPGFLASKFPIVFMQTDPVAYGLASGTVGPLGGLNRHYRFEVHTDTTIAQFQAALQEQAFSR